MTPDRTLTHDEKKASEAAFRGLPFDPSWTQSAKEIYDGIVHALGEKTLLPTVTQKETEVEIEIEKDTSLWNTESLPTTSEEDSSETFTIDIDALPIKSRRESIENGILKDVTPLAQSMGLDFCVGITNPLWDQYISSSPDLTEDHIQTRLRDTLMAVRLRLASLKTPSPLIDVPVLLEFDQDPTPQLCLTFALFHKDPVDGDCVLLIHPGEVFATRQNSSNN